jgi:hypothetical protein
MVTKVPITERALLQRVNRALADDGKVVNRPRGKPRADGPGDLGAFFIVDLKKKAVVEKNVDLVKLAKKLEVLRDYEQLVD